MKKMTFTFLTLFLLLFSQLAFSAPKYLQGTYDIDPMHTRVSFVIPHFVISEVEGRFDEIKGSMVLGKSFLDSSFEATVPVKSIDTGVVKRDEHLRSKDFFEVDKFPEIKFVSKSITGTMENFKMVATLTIKGVSKDVLFTGEYTGVVKDSWGKQRAALKATAKVNRKDFNITYNDKIDLGPVVGDMVEIRLWAEGVMR